MEIPKLEKSERDREYKKYNESTIDKVVYGYLFEGKSHRRLDDEYLTIDSEYNRGFEAMNILHYLGLKNNWKGFFKDTTLKKAIKAMENTGELDYEVIADSLRRLQSKNRDRKSTWMITADSQKYNYEKWFEQNEAVDWIQKSNYKVGDIVYIYAKRPVKKVLYKTIVEKVDMIFAETMDDEAFWRDQYAYENSKQEKFCRLRVLERNDSDLLALDKMQSQGLSEAPRRPVKVPERLIEYLNKNFSDSEEAEFFPDTIEPSVSYEGARKKVYVNRYERSPVARKQCIQSKGCHCHVCGINFENVYGEIGKGFIHIHHLVPLSAKNKEYQVNYEKDLIPVCPNCHAMLHRKVNGKTLSIEQLQRVLAYRNQIEEHTEPDQF